MVFEQCTGIFANAISRRRSPEQLVTLPDTLGGATLCLDRILEMVRRWVGCIGERLVDAEIQLTVRG
ncbi:unnamed protein product [Gongylonema pulchrum]|uniref:DHC_N1 domain-containing protein n=1 Tax=Gongylonema pulchrum TaxID=637853 RepID=A0A183DT04_9BILA|nr:unnamed protein product [Gongylonema pulchrum]